MPIHFSLFKIDVLLTSSLLTLCCVWLSPAHAEYASGGPPVPLFRSLPDDIASSTGKWQNRHIWRDLGEPEAASPTSSAPLQFKAAESSWWGIVDAVSYVVPVIGSGGMANLGVSGKPFQASRGVNSPVPPK